MAHTCCPASSPSHRWPSRPRAGPCKDTVYFVDGTLVPTRDRSVAASRKNYRYSTNLQVVIDANSRLVVAIGRCPAVATTAESGIDRACRGAPTIADGGYQGTSLLVHRAMLGIARLHNLALMG